MGSSKVDIDVAIVSGGMRLGHRGGKSFKSSAYKAQQSIIHAYLTTYSYRPTKSKLSVSGTVRAYCDLDNALKTIFDSLEGFVFENDRQIVQYKDIRLERERKKERQGFSLVFEEV